MSAQLFWIPSWILADFGSLYNNSLFINHLFILYIFHLIRLKWDPNVWVLLENIEWLCVQFILYKSTILSKFWILLMCLWLPFPSIKYLCKSVYLDKQSDRLTNSHTLKFTTYFSADGGRENMHRFTYIPRLDHLSVCVVNFEVS